MKLENKWYLQPWLISLLFAAWFLLIPPFIGICLLVLYYKQKKRNLQAIEAVMTPELRNYAELHSQVQTLSASKEKLERKLSQLGDLADLNSVVQKLETKRKDLDANLSILEKEYTNKKEKLIVMEDDIQVQEFGLYKPTYDFASSLDYKEKLLEIRATQKDLIKKKLAVTGVSDWTVNGNKRQGTKMVSDTQKLLLRAFNIECDEIVSKVKYTNFDSSLNHLYKAAETISNLGTIMCISITQTYIQSKVNELRLAFEYRQKKQAEKEAAKIAREEMREVAKLQAELDAQRAKLEKEQTHYQTAYDKICAQLENDPNNKDLISKKTELESHLENVEKSLKDVDYREANQKAGYVYVISNIGAFGENVYKIGMTRRLDPQERIDELGCAAVPFNFDVHAMIFSDDAPALEATLHRAFEDKKINMVNQRREFFRVSLDEIKDVIRKNYDKTVEFIDIPDAEQYRISEKMHELAS